MRGVTVSSTPPPATAPTPRGQATRARLLRAARDVVADIGYPHATTRAIAQAAGVSEGTIYRHFPDKATLFLAAVIDANEPVVAGMATLVDQAGNGTVAENLAEALTRLASLREQLLPLELAMLTDPELAAHRPRHGIEAALRRPSAAAGAPDRTGPLGPPRVLADYLAAEQRLGRIRPELDPVSTAVVILAALFGIALGSDPDGSAAADGQLIRHFADLLTHGLQV